jgi:hypothetical protein
MVVQCTCTVKSIVSVVIMCLLQSLNPLFEGLKAMESMPGNPSTRGTIKTKPVFKSESVTGVGVGGGCYGRYITIPHTTACLLVCVCVCWIPLPPPASYV